MSVPDHFPRRFSRAVPDTAAPPGSTPAGRAAGAPGSWPWRRAAPLAIAVLVTGMIGQVSHTAVFFLPALAAMAGAAVRLWREGA